MFTEIIGVYKKLSKKKVDTADQIDTKLILKDVGHHNQVFSNTEDYLDVDEKIHKVIHLNDHKINKSKEYSVAGKAMIPILNSLSNKANKRLHNLREDKRINSFKYLKLKDGTNGKNKNFTNRTQRALKSIRCFMSKFKVKSDLTEECKKKFNHSNLPLVLITDTAVMHTEVIDMKNFNPELNQSKSIKAKPKNCY